MTCSAGSCEKPVIARGWCTTHYARERRAGRFQALQRRPVSSAIERLFRYIDRSGGPDACWPWTGGHNESGYGITYLFEGRRRISIGTHRAIYRETTGPIPKGMHVLHSCHNPPCCNPAHLRIGTHRENMADRQAHGATKPTGSWAPHAVPVDPATVAAIRSTYRKGVKGFTLRDLGRQFGLDQMIIFQIVNHRGRWAVRP